MMLDDQELNAMIRAERQKMLYHFATLPKETTDRLKDDDARRLLYQMMRDMESIAEACIRHPAVVECEDSYRYAMIVRQATRSLINTKGRRTI